MLIESKQFNQHQLANPLLPISKLLKASLFFRKNKQFSILRCLSTEISISFSKLFPKPSNLLRSKRRELHLQRTNPLANSAENESDSPKTSLLHFDGFIDQVCTRVSRICFTCFGLRYKNNRKLQETRVKQFLRFSRQQENRVVQMDILDTL